MLLFMFMNLDDRFSEPFVCQEPKINPNRNILAGYLCRQPGQQLLSGLRIPGKTSIMVWTSRADAHDKLQKNFGLVISSLLW